MISAHEARYFYGFTPSERENKAELAFKAVDKVIREAANEKEHIARWDANSFSIVIRNEVVARLQALGFHTAYSSEGEVVILW